MSKPETTDLQESEQRYANLLDALFDSVVIHDRGEILQVNRAFARNNGTLPEDMVGMMLPDLVAPESRPLLEQAVSLAHDGPYELVGQPSEGGAAHLVICARSTIFNGRPARMVAIRDITEQKRMEERLKRLLAEKQALASKVFDTQEAERLNMARELHDEVGQMLAVLKMESDWIERNATDPQEVRRASHELRRKIDQTLAMVRSLCHDLRPSCLDDLGVGCALETLLREIIGHTQIACESTLEEPEALSPAIATAIYRIAQEALANMVRHGQAHRAWITLRPVDDAIELSVEHDGAEVPRTALHAPGSLGIAGMRERAALLDGTLKIDRREGGGTVLVVKIPLCASPR